MNEKKLESESETGEMKWEAEGKEESGLKWMVWMRSMHLGELLQ